MKKLSKRKISKIFRISRSKADQVIAGNIGRKPSMKKLSPEVAKLVTEFYTCEEISRVNPCGSKALKKHGALRYMNYPF